ncbi:MAG: hypothetical protein Q8O95_01915 [bacterium]|nr:hypothetical protein [bacterium]
MKPIDESNQEDEASHELVIQGSSVRILCSVLELKLRSLLDDYHSRLNQLLGQISCDGISSVADKSYVRDVDGLRVQQFFAQRNELLSFPEELQSMIKAQVGVIVRENPGVNLDITQDFSIRLTSKEEEGIPLLVDRLAPENERDRFVLRSVQRIMDMIRTRIDELNTQHPKASSYLKSRVILHMETALNKSVLNDPSATLGDRLSAARRILIEQLSQWVGWVLRPS